LNVIANYATTGSNSFRADQSITGSLVVSSTITAQTLVVQTVTSSIVYSSGSNIFGSALTDRQTFTGSVNITGSTTLNGALTGTSATFNGDIAYNNVGNQNLIITSGAANNGRMYIYSGGAADIGFQASGSSWFLNKLGIGTNNPTYKLEISGSSGTFSFNPNQASAMIIRGSVTGNFDINNEGTSGVMRLYGTSIQLRTAAVDPALTIASTGAATFAGNVGITIADTPQLLLTHSNTSKTFLMAVDNSNAFFRANSTNSILFQIAGGTTALTIASTGAATFASSVYFNGSVYNFVGGNKYFAAGGVYNYLYAGSTQLSFVNQADTAVIATINGSTGAYTATSDINKKKDFEASTIGLNAILGLKPTLYRMKDDTETSEKHLGFIAQEVREFIPQAYIEQIDGERTFIGLKDRPIISALVKAIQELKAEIDELKNK
jgi:hypothetical protein